MWYITHATSGQTFCFLPEKLKYNVGRAGADLELQNDNCVSRAHSVFHLTQNNDQLQLQVEDVGSKFGTFYNSNIEKNVPLQKGNKIVLKENDLVRFGRLQNVWKVSCMNLSTVTSSLSKEDVENVKSNVLALGGQILEQWTSSCSHLTMKEPSITMKLLHALVDQKCVVTPDYWKALLEFGRNKKKELPKPILFSPSFGDDDINFGCKTERRSLFKGTTFVFLNRKHFDMYSPIVQAAGGTCKDLNSGIQKTFLIKTSVVVVQYTPSTQTESSQTINNIAEFLESNSKRVIPEYEIGLAIMHCSIEKFCNPNCKMTQTMPLTMTHDTVDESMNIDLTDDRDSTPSADTQSLDLEIPETNESSHKLNTNNTNESMPNMCITETPVDNPRKRKVVSVDLEESDEDGLFKFPSKKSFTEVQDSQTPSTSADKSAKNVNNFLEKSQMKSHHETEEQSSANKEARKRPHIQVLDENDENDDDLFRFGDTQKNKKSRSDEKPVDGNEYDLFNFKDKVSNDAADEDSIDMMPTQSFIVPEKPIRSKSSIYVTKPNILPRKVSAIEWISGSLGKIRIKNENDLSAVKEENEGEVDGVKTESDMIKTEIKDEDPNMTDDHRKWLESLKDAIEIQQVALNNGIKCGDKSHYIFKNRLNNGTAENRQNFKTFVKKYVSTEHNNLAN